MFVPIIFTFDEVQTGNRTDYMRIIFLVWVNERHRIHVAVGLIHFSVLLVLIIPKANISLKGCEEMTRFKTIIPESTKYQRNFLNGFGRER